MHVNANGINLYYEKSEHKPKNAKHICNSTPLILLHGNGEDSSIFSKLTPGLRTQFTVYSLDSRNHGKSEYTATYDYAVMAQDVYAFTQAMGLEKVNLLGFSDGGIIALMLAINNAEIVNRMALLGVNLSPEDLLEDVFSEMKNEYEKTKCPLFKLMLTQPNISINTLTQVNTPTLLVAGENDIFKPDLYHRMLCAMPNAKFLLMKGHTHDSYIVSSDLLYDDLAGFFEKEECKCT